MSGGSMDYLYRKVEDAGFNENTPLRRAFRAHLTLIAKALHDIEWVDSGDFAPGDDVKAILACVAPSAVLHQAIKDAEAARENLDDAISRGRA